MRICYLASPSVHTDRWVRFFADKGDDVHIITSVDRYVGDVGDTKVHYLKRIGPRSRAANYLINSLPLILQFNKLLKDIEPDIIHAHSVQDIALLAALGGFHPFVVTVWGSDILIEPRKSRMSKWMADYILKKADVVTCDGVGIQELLIRMGLLARKVHIVYFGADTNKFSPRRKDPELLESLGMTGYPVIISIRSLMPVYDVQSLIRAVPIILGKVPRAKFLIVGKGSEENKLKALAGSLNVANSVVFLGRLEDEELPRFLASSQIYVSTSLSDTTSVSLLEAMASGLPAVVTDSGDSGKWVKDGQNGFVVPPGSYNLLAEKILRLLNDRQMGEKMGRISRTLVEDNADYLKEMGKMAGIYEQLIRKVA